MGPSADITRERRGLDSTPGVDLLTRAVVDQIPLAVLLGDHDGRILYRNAEADALFTRVTSCSAVLASGTATEPAVPWDECQARLKRGAGSVQLGTMTIHDPGGRKRRVSVSVHALRPGPDQESLGYLIQAAPQGQLTDFTTSPTAGGGGVDGSLVARVAHELNNPLDGIMRFVNLALRSADDTQQSQIRSYLEPARQGLKRMAQIIGELLEFARSGDSQAEAKSINRVVEEALRTLEEKCDQAGISAVADFRESGMPTVRQSKYFQVCCNLFKNAIEAMPDGGRLTITSAVIDDHVVLRVEDTGVGLPEDAERVFEPFFTTKRDRDGTGLGLAICKEYVEGLGGRITAERRPQGGSVFTVQVPVARFTETTSTGVNTP